MDTLSKEGGNTFKIVLAPFLKGSTLKGKNLLLTGGRKLFPFRAENPLRVFSLNSHTFIQCYMNIILWTMSSVINGLSSYCLSTLREKLQIGWHFM